MTPAEERATREGLPVVAVTNFDLAHVLQGNPVIVGTLDGGEALLRLYTPDELLAAVEKAGEHFAAQGIPEGPGMDWDKAVELTTPIGGGS